MCYIMKCEWLKNESNYFVTCKYFRLILQPLQTLQTIHNTSFICAIIFVFFIYITFHINVKNDKNYIERIELTLVHICNSLKRLQNQPKVLTSYKIIRLTFHYMYIYFDVFTKSSTVIDIDIDIYREI